MTWGMVAVAGATVVGAGMSYAGAQAQADAAKDAAKGSGAASKYAADVQNQQFQQTRQDQAPWLGSGQLGLSALTYGLGLSPTGYTPGMSGQVAGMVGPGAQQYGDAAKLLEGGDQWEIVQPAGYRQPMQVRNTVTGELRTVPVALERDKSAFKREQIAQAAASGWGLSGETPMQAGAIISGPKSMPTANQVAQSQQKMNALATGGGQGAAGSGSAPAYAGATGLHAGDLMRSFTMADYQADPGYAFRQQQGQQQIDRQAAARGGLISGAALKATQRFGQDLASQEYQNAYNRFNNDQTAKYNRLASLAGVGQTASNSLASAGQNYANNAGNIAMQNAANQGNAAMAAGNARASGYMGIANALAGGAANWGGRGGGGFSSAPNMNASWGYGTNPGYSAGEWA